VPKIPTRYPRWAYDADPGDIIEPPTGVREVGYQTGQRPPAQFFNHHFNLIGGWVDFLRGPNAANWTRSEIDPEASTNIGGIAVDVSTPDTGPLARFVAALKDDTTNVLTKVFVSYRGHNFEEVVSPFSSSPTGAFVDIQFSGGRWFIMTVNNMYTTPADDGVVATAVRPGTSTNFFASGESPIRRIAYDGNAIWAAVFGDDPAEWKFSSDGENWGPFPASAGVGGEGKDIVWDGSYFVSVTDDGEIWRSPNAATAFSQVATLATTGDLRLVASIAEGKILAIKVQTTTPTAYVSTDHGATWTEVTLPFSGTHLARTAVYDDGAWFVVESHYPALWMSNDLVIWVPAVLPFMQTGMAVTGTGTDSPSMLAVGRGSIVLTKSNGDPVFQSHIARDAASGSSIAFNAPVALSDAAYFDGRPLELGVSPNEGQVWAWSVAEQQYVLTSVAGVGDPDAFEQSFTFAGGAYDYTTDPNWDPADYPDADANLSQSGVLGDNGAVPYFYAVNRDNFAAGGLTRTAGGRLRIDWDSGSDTWPTDANGQIVAIPLPDSRRIEVEFTVYLSATALAASNRLRFGIGRADYGASTPDRVVDVYVEAQSATEADEIVNIWTNTYSADSVDSYVTSNEFARHYRIKIDGGNIAVYGGAVGATTATTLLHGRSNALLGMSRRDLVLFFGVAVGSTENGLRVEIDNLHWVGNRKP
jgi:hypothetical protein